jgi:predicted metal-dependent hydrolase
VRDRPPPQEDARDRVEPAASVVIAAPEEATLDAIEAKLRKRAAWVTRQQRYFSQFLPRTPDRRFVAGETHLYLGRQYRLKVVPHVKRAGS